MQRITLVYIYRIWYTHLFSDMNKNRYLPYNSQFQFRKSKRKNGISVCMFGRVILLLFTLFTQNRCRKFNLLILPLDFQSHFTVYIRTGHVLLFVLHSTWLINVIYLISFVCFAFRYFGFEKLILFIFFILLFSFFLLLQIECAEEADQRIIWRWARCLCGTTACKQHQWLATEFSQANNIR